MTTNLINKNKLISFVIPVYNEEKSIEKLYLNLKKNILKINYFYEIIFIDDGSTDKSAEILKKISKLNKKLN